MLTQVHAYMYVDKAHVHPSRVAGAQDMAPGVPFLCAPGHDRAMSPSGHMVAMQGCGQSEARKVPIRIRMRGAGVYVQCHYGLRAV